MSRPKTAPSPPPKLSPLAIEVRRYFRELSMQGVMNRRLRKLRQQGILQQTSQR